MPCATTFAVLAELGPDKAIPYLRAALLEPFPDLQRQAVRALEQSLKRHDVIIEQYPSLLPEIRAEVAEKKGIYLDVARRLIRSGLERQRRASYDFLASAAGTDCAAELALGVNDSSAMVREQVAESLEKIALQYHVRLLNAQTRADETSIQFVERNRARILDTLEQLFQSFQIHRKTVFIEIAINLGPEAYHLICKLVLARPESPLYRAFLHAMESANSEPSMELLFRLHQETDERLVEAADLVFQQRRDPQFLAALAAHFSNLLPDRLRPLASRAKRIPWWPTLCAQKELGPTVALPHVEFISMASIPGPQRLEYLRHFLKSPEAQVRAAALQQLEEHNPGDLLELARQFLNDPDEDVALVAARCVARLNPPDKIKLLTPFVKAESPELRRFAMREVSRASLDRYLASFERLDPRTRAVAARAIAKIDAGMIDRLTEEVQSLDPKRRIKALQILDYAEMDKDSQPVIREMLRDPDIRVRATAIKLVEMSGNIEGMKTVIQALNDPDRRVRANAIEAFDDIGDTRFMQLLMPFCQDPDNRVRGNAVKALWNLGRREVIDVLHQMLHDKDENMRLTAIWVISEIRQPGAIQALTARLEAEQSERVAQKIVEALAKLNEGSPG